MLSQSGSGLVNVGRPVRWNEMCTDSGCLLNCTKMVTIRTYLINWCEFNLIYFRQILLNIESMYISLSITENHVLKSRCIPITKTEMSSFHLLCDVPCMFCRSVYVDSTFLIPSSGILSKLFFFSICIILMV